MRVPEKFARIKLAMGDCNHGPEGREIAIANSNFWICFGHPRTQRVAASAML
uniref:Uncharacterized protein n=1 Tax=Anguilla anguilla TaxID=7936 RepID=A0A0E9SVL7_ANGAN